VSLRGCVVSVRRYLAVIQDPRGYADELEPAPPEGPIPVVVQRPGLRRRRGGLVSVFAAAVASWGLGCVPAFVVIARAYARRPSDPFEDDSELKPLATAVAALLWPLGVGAWSVGWIVGWGYRRATSGVSK